MSIALEQGRNALIESELTRFSDARHMLLRVQLWLARQRGRKALARLDSRELADIGIDAGSAAREASRPFWEGDDALVERWNADQNGE